MTDRTLAPAKLPRDHLAWADALGLRPVSYLQQAVEVADPNGASRLNPGDEPASRRCWLPRDLIAFDGSCCVLWRPADREYDFDGWQPEHSTMFGCRTIGAVLNWIERAKAIRAGTAQDFRGC